MITFIIDDQKIAALPGSTVLEAASAAGIYIPALCYHPDLSNFGGCRICTVEINGKMIRACFAQAEENMVVWTDTAEVAELRRKALEKILAAHNPDCQACTRNGDCELQKASAFVGFTQEHLAGLARNVSKVPSDTSNPFFNLDHTRCILCAAVSCAAFVSAPARRLTALPPLISAAAVQAKDVSKR